MIQKSLKDLSFCNSIPLPGYNSPYRKKYTLRKSKTYDGKPHSTHLRLIKDKDKGKRTTKCKCYICGEEGHFARNCRSKKGRLDRANFYNNAEIPKDWDVISVGMDEDDRDEICSLSDGEGPAEDTISAMIRSPFQEEDLKGLEYMAHFAMVLIFDQPYGQKSTWMTIHAVPEEQKSCQHTWSDLEQHGQRKCAYCWFYVEAKMSAQCEMCKLTACATCLHREHQIKIVWLRWKGPSRIRTN